jgi:hypothetical protein
VMMASFFACRIVHGTCALVVLPGLADAVMLTVAWLVMGVCVLTSTTGIAFELCIHDHYRHFELPPICA